MKIIWMRRGGFSLLLPVIVRFQSRWCVNWPLLDEKKSRDWMISVQPLLLCYWYILCHSTAWECVNLPWIRGLNVVWVLETLDVFSFLKVMKTCVVQVLVCMSSQGWIEKVMVFCSPFSRETLRINHQHGERGMLLFENVVIYIRDDKDVNSLVFALRY